jgi:5S rRNA maturation endonuclease (ribonuclease M5)
MILKIGQAGEMRHKDMAYPDDERFSGGAVDFVMSRYGLSYGKALEKISQDFCLLEGEKVYREITDKYVKPVMDIKRSCFIQVSARGWEKRDVQYWEQFGIGVEQLNKENVYPLKEAFINRKNVFSESESKKEIAYIYRYTNGFKLYYPTREKSEKWKNNIKSNVVEGLEKVNGQEKVIITKSKKDKIVLNNCLEPFHVLVLSVQNECAAGITPELLNRLKGKQIYIGFDCDDPGRKASLKINEDHPEFRHVNVPTSLWETQQIKDWADWYKGYGKEVLLDHFKTKKII